MSSLSQEQHWRSIWSETGLYAERLSTSNSDPTCSQYLRASSSSASAGDWKGEFLGTPFVQHRTILPVMHLSPCDNVSLPTHPAESTHCTLSGLRGCWTKHNVHLFFHIMAIQSPISWDEVRQCGWLFVLLQRFTYSDLFDEVPHISQPYKKTQTMWTLFFARAGMDGGVMRWGHHQIKLHYITLFMDVTKEPDLPSFLFCLVLIARGGTNN